MSLFSPPSRLSVSKALPICATALVHEMESQLIDIENDLVTKLQQIANLGDLPTEELRARIDEAKEDNEVREKNVEALLKEVKKNDSEEIKHAILVRANEDGCLSREEFGDAMRSLVGEGNKVLRKGAVDLYFGFFDKDGSGIIDKEEFAAVGVSWEELAAAKQRPQTPSHKLLRLQSPPLDDATESQAEAGPKSQPPGTDDEEQVEEPPAALDAEHGLQSKSSWVIQSDKDRRSSRSSRVSFGADVAMSAVSTGASRSPFSSCALPRASRPPRHAPLC